MAVTENLPADQPGVVSARQPAGSYPDMADQFGCALVTGGAGFLGSHLCERLLDAGTRVVCVDNLSTGSRENIADFADRDFRIVETDLIDVGGVDERCDVVFHLACPAAPRHYYRLPVATLRVGSAGTERALNIASAAGARFVLASTSEVYGDPLVHPQHESYWGNVNPVGPRSVYDEAKRYAEAITTAYRASYGTRTAIARIFNTYGPRMRQDDGRVVPTFVRQALDGEVLTVHGDGTQTRSLCYVSDTVDGLIRLAYSDCAGPVNIGNPHELPVGEIAGTICRLVGLEQRVRYSAGDQDDPKRRCPDVSEALIQLGWRPRVCLDEGLTRTIEWTIDRKAGHTPPVGAAR